ncbi:cutinase transcription factor 1 alpha [Aspergillus terreus NIH2624]|uniref:Cutinase transcription factor 1 alpha n=1 Tax=Aspergillus terreus (strain NIH 2624 / FGSC A1156) TaxID=341663 RepID=Q0CVP1_ASPTN|nr:cutinase transcription factor 1 alpha [Aspergillus terreus NIH2624]EAU37205.1 cutinase transcription factor 1 alpha [Aspergillus terreus NIH2624]
MSTTGENHTDSTSRPSPAPSATGSTGTSGITVRAGPNGHMSFRRQRASRACETCHARKVRCDAASLGVPCTNCVAFSIECKIPTPKRKKNQNKSKETSGSEAGSERPPTKQEEEAPAADGKNAFGYRSNRMAVDGMPVTTLSDQQVAEQASQNNTYAQFMKPKFARAPIKEAGEGRLPGRVVESVAPGAGSPWNDRCRALPPFHIRGSRSRLTDLDNLELDILHQRGAFLLPPKPLCDELVEAYFKWVAPVVPIVNRSRFMRHYRDPKNPPSLLLLQAILLAGSRVCTNPQLMDANGSTTPAAMTFYKRAKALYDANYEDDRVTIVQALVLLGWYWEGPEDVTKNVFYWTRVAMVVAQGSGMHRSVESSQLSKPDKRLWKRIWWTLFTRDRSVAVALGRPIGINTDDSDVGMLTEDDFIEDEIDIAAEYPPDPVHVQFFLQYVKLCEIMGLVLSQQYSVASKSRRMNAMDLTHSDMALADWLQNCPQRSLLAAIAAPLLGRASPRKLLTHQEIRYTPAFMYVPAHQCGSSDTHQVNSVYSLFSALIMHVYQMRSSVPTIVATCQERINICMQALKDVSKVWLVAKMVHTLFESILGNKVLEERLQKAAGRRHQKVRPEANQQQALRRPDPPPKRKFDDMDIGLPNGGPTPPVSYERSRPQTPAVTPSRELSQPGLGVPQASPTAHRDGGPGNSRANTRPTTPFNGQFSLPATPPDLFLVTRTSPNLSPSLWENFQPDQLFPDGTAIFPELTSPQHNAVDPQLQMQTQLQTQGIDQRMMGQPVPSRSMSGTQGSPELLSSMPPGIPLQGQQPPQMFGMEHQGSWPMQGLEATLSAATVDPANQDDNWSSSSRSGPTAPTTLNVEDWFQFFGINGSLGWNAKTVHDISLKLAYRSNWQPPHNKQSHHLTNPPTR